MLPISGDLYILPVLLLIGLRFIISSSPFTVVTTSKRFNVNPTFASYFDFIYMMMMYVFFMYHFMCCFFSLFIYMFLYIRNLYFYFTHDALMNFV